MRDLNIFYKNTEGIITYNTKCQECNLNCKQSFRANIIMCPKTKTEKNKRKRR